MNRTAESTGDFDAVSHVLDAFRVGEPVLVHDFDDHGDETGLVYPAGAVDFTDVARMRSDAGGLVCVAFPNGVSESLGLPFMDDVFDHLTASFYNLAYDSRSSFSFTVSHRDSFIGVANRDHAVTISRLTPVVKVARAGEYDVDDFGGKFRAPDHAHLLRGAPDLLSGRQGYTEPGLALTDGAGISPAVVVCGTPDDETGAALPKDAARGYADRRGFVFVDGDGLIGELV